MEELREGAVFCPNCGKNQATGKNAKTASSPKKKKYIIAASIVVGLILFSAIWNAINPSIVGTWMCGTDQVIFESDGSFSYIGSSDITYRCSGGYSINKNKTLEVNASGYFMNMSDTLYYGKEAKHDSDYWYLEGNKLYFRGDVYTRTK